MSIGRNYNSEKIDNKRRKLLPIERRNSERKKCNHITFRNKMKLNSDLTKNCKISILEG